MFASRCARSLFAPLLVVALGASACKPASKRGAPGSYVQDAALSPAASPDASLAALLARVPSVATGNPGISQFEDALVRDFWAFGEIAVPHLVALLASDDPKVRTFAAYTLSDINGLSDAHLDTLAARTRGDPWIRMAIIGIGSPRAIQLFVDDLRAAPNWGSLERALATSGGRVAVPLARVFESRTSAADLAWLVCKVFEAMASRAAPAVDVLLARAALEDGPLENRLSAIRALGCVGPAARGAIPRLQSVAALQPDELRDNVLEALVRIGTPEAVPILTSALREQPESAALLRDIARMRQTARDAGAAMIPMLRSANRDVRLAAARTLGFVGYAAEPAGLIGLLQDDDWQVVFVAAESLGRLKIASALAALDDTATRHWYPPVRESARSAARIVRGVEQSPPPSKEFSREYSAYEHVTVPAAQSAPSLVRGSEELTQHELASLAPASTTNEGREPGSRTPIVGLRTAAGVLLGSDDGEWGGDLVYRSRRSGPVVLLLEENVIGLHRLGTKTVVVAGLAHLSTNRGALYLATVGSTGKYEVTRWKTLPGAPRKSGIARDGSLFVSCTGGDVVVKSDSRMEMAAGQQ